MWNVKKHFAFFPKLVDNKLIWLEIYFSYYHISSDFIFDADLSPYYVSIIPKYKRKL